MATLPAGSSTPFSAWRGWVLVLALSGFGVLLAVRSEKSLLWAAAFWIILGLGLFCLWIKPRIPEILMFLLLPLGTAVVALAGVSTLAVAVAWVAMLLGWWYLDGVSGQWRTPAVKTAFAPLLILYSFLFIISAFANRSHESVYLSFVKVVPLVGIYWIWAQVMRGQDLRRLLVALMWGCVGASLVFLYFFRGMSAKAALGGLIYGVGRPTILGLNANTWAALAMFGLVVLATLLFWERRRRRDLLWMIPAGLVLTATAVVNMSRSALLGMMGGIALVMVFHPRGRRLMLAGSAGLFAYLAVFKPEILALMAQMFRFKAGLSGRETIWATAWQVITENPFLGLGPGWFRERVFFYAPFSRNGLTMGIDQLNTHNAFLMISVDLGLFATLTALAILGLFALRSYQLWPRLKGRPEFAILVGLNALVFCAVLRSLFEVYFIAPHIYLDQSLVLITFLALQDILYSREFSTA